MISAIILNIFLWILVIITITVLFALCMWAWTGIFSEVPFIIVPSSVLPEIEKALELKEESVFYDIGCGDGRVLSYLTKKDTGTKMYGIENRLFPLCLAYLLTSRNKKKNNIKIINQDFSKQDLSEATHIFIYLYPNIMDDLLSKFEKELSPGTRLVSLSFKFTQKRHLYEIDLSRKSWELGKKLYVYEF
jgi:SAM-dependent methyltransferase